MATALPRVVPWRRRPRRRSADSDHATPATSRRCGASLACRGGLLGFRLRLELVAVLLPRLGLARSRVFLGFSGACLSAFASVCLRVSALGFTTTSAAVAPSNAVLLSPPARSGALYAGLTGGSGSSWLWQPPSGSLGQDSALGPADEECPPPGSWELGADGKTGNIDSGLGIPRARRMVWAAPGNPPPIRAS